MNLYLLSTTELIFFIEIDDAHIFKIKSSNTKVEVLDEGRRPEGLGSVEFNSIADFKKIIEPYTTNIHDIVFCIAFLVKLKNHYP